MIDKELNGWSKEVLSILFAFGLAVGHYGIPYIFLFSSLFVLLFLFLNSKIGLFKGIERANLTTSNFVLLFLLLIVAWYIYTGEGSGFAKVVRLGHHIISHMMEFFSPIVGGGSYYLTAKTPTLDHEVLKILHLVSQLFIVVGFFNILLQKLRGIEKDRFQTEYFLYCMAFLGWLAIAVIMPYVVGGKAIGLVRMYSLCLLFLSPLCIIGGREIFKKSRIPNVSDNWTKALGLFLLIFLLFNSKFVMEVHQEIQGGEYHISSFPLSLPKAREGKCVPEDLAGFYQSFYSEIDVSAVEWIAEYKDEKQRIISERYGVVVWYEISNVELIGHISRVYEGMLKNSLIYLRKCTYVYGILPGEKYGDWWEASELLSNLEKNKNKIYSNGGSVIYG